MENTTENEKIVKSVTDLDWDDWYPAGAVAVVRQKGTEARKELAGMLTAAFMKHIGNLRRIAQLLRKCPDIDPDTHAFKVFRDVKLAELLEGNHAAIHQLREHAIAGRFGEGGLTWVEGTAKDPKKVIADINRDVGEDEDLAAATVTMWVLHSYKYEQLCELYPEYRRIPRVEMVEGEGGEDEDGDGDGDEKDDGGDDEDDDGEDEDEDDEEEEEVAAEEEESE
ncbi:hypothetical protein LZ554_002034 [Drepanopeziza brunnea f. sp. 'monogermtubi']|nr:hypothetical protein LZ554_002034 [Drepanopeziza brunnea f. sp. 'monogermtubi']